MKRVEKREKWGEEQREERRKEKIQSIIKKKNYKMFKLRKTRLTCGKKIRIQ